MLLLAIHRVEDVANKESFVKKPELISLLVVQRYEVRF